ncbi:MAG TPA: carbohydrate ABC transporter permease [Chloroflexota bacterium]|nr:carbohydrate ABC transporter permease [Chloroflexota bacterium]
MAADSRAPAATSPATPLFRQIRRQLRPEQIAANALLLVIVLICLLPIVWAVSSSLKGSKELYQAVPSLLPASPTLGNYTFILTRRGMEAMPQNVLNSLQVSVVAMLLTVLLATMAGYGFGRLAFPGRDGLFYAITMLMFVPRAGGLMAAYELMAFLHLRDSDWGLALAFTGALSIPIFIMRQTFLTIPREVEEAGIIDGASPWQLFWQVDAPMATGGMVVVAILTFIQSWGDYLFTLTMIDSPEKMTLSVAISQISSWSSALFQSSAFATYGAQAAGQVLLMAPVIVVFIFLQRWFIRGLQDGALKL